MRVTSVRISSDDDKNFIDLSYKDPRRQNPYNVKGIFGLDADSLTPQNYAVASGKSYYNLWMAPRDVVARIELYPDYKKGETVSDLRDRAYRMISSSRTSQVNVIFYDEQGKFGILTGFITKFETAQFQEVPEIQITINCEDPMIRAIEEVEVDVSDFDPNLFTVTDLVSTAPHGFKMAVQFTANRNTFTIKAGLGGNEWSFDIDATSDPFVIGDILFLSSEREKQLYRDRSGTITHIADKILLDAVWPIMFYGENTFAIDFPADYDFVSLSYTPVYWGV